MKIIICGFLVFITMGSLSGVDLTGHFGMGVGFSPSAQSALIPMDIAVTRIGWKPRITLEPMFYYSYLKKTNGVETTDIASEFLLVVDYTFKQHEQTNIYAKAGLGIGFNEPQGLQSSYNALVPFGFGIEYFFVHRLSANISALSAIQVTMNPANIEGTEMSLRLGNKRSLVYFYLCWYY